MHFKLHVKTLQPQATPWVLSSVICRRGILERIKLVTVFSPIFGCINSKDHVVNSRTFSPTQVAGNWLKHKVAACLSSPCRHPWHAGEAEVSMHSQSMTYISRGHMPEKANLFPRDCNWHYCPTSCPSSAEKSALRGRGTTGHNASDTQDAATGEREGEASQATRSALEM